VLAFTLLNSLGTGAVQNGVYFLLKSAYGYGRLENYRFGLVLYGAYVAGALAAGPAIRRAARTHEGLNTRAVLLAVVVGQAAFSLLPRGVGLIAGVETPPEWTMWAVAIAYGVLSGVMWPVVESYLSGGRSGRRLASATGVFNVVWSGAVLASFWMMAPLVESQPLDVILALGLVQLLSVSCLWFLAPEPGRHLAHDHQPHPASWARLLATFRVLLPLSYLVAGTLSPLLPTTLDRAGVALAWGPPAASAWLAARVLVFFAFERWHGWHGRAWMPPTAGVLLLAGFAGVVLAPRLGSAALPALLVGLTVFGGAHAMIYLGSLYYALEVGKAEVDAGGMHEALIGLGYALGPALGLGVLLASGGREGANFDAWLSGAVGVIGIGAMVAVAYRTRSISDHESAGAE
jgi:hypothetical protein